MTHKLFAGVDDGLYEYAIWSPNKESAISGLGLAHIFGELSDQSSNKALKAICSDRTKAYRRDLGHEENEWEPFERSIKVNSK